MTNDVLILLQHQVKCEQKKLDDMRKESKILLNKLQNQADLYLTIDTYIALRGISVDTNRANLLGRKAVKVSEEYGVKICKAYSTIFGKVNSYHVDVLCEVFKAI